MEEVTYAEARGAESDRDFLLKLRIVQKELNETEVWLQVMITTGLGSEDSVQSLPGVGKEPK